jgi:hypothetical protein
MYTDAGHVVDTLIHILNSEQEFFRDYVRQYESEKAEREFPLSVCKGIYPTRPRELMPMLELEPENENTEWATNRGQRTQFNVVLQLTLASTNPDLSVEYITGWVRRLKVILNDPRRLQAWVTSEDGKRQYRWSYQSTLVPLSFLDSLMTDVDYKTLQAGSLRQARMSWFCKVHQTLPAKAFIGHWPHYTGFGQGPPYTGPNE